MINRLRFIDYLINVRRINERTINHYVGAIKTISNELYSCGIIETSIFMIQDSEIIQNLKDIYWSIPQLKEKDNRGNRMYSAALNRYKEFFIDMNSSLEYITQGGIVLDKKLDYIDKPVERRIELSEHYKERISRNAQTSGNAIITADYKCENNVNHYYFDSKATGKPYVEAHHLIPISGYKMFLHSIDVEANIVSLCPVCHRKLHHAKIEDKLDILSRFYEARLLRLQNCGIAIPFDDFIEYYK